MAVISMKRSTTASVDDVWAVASDWSLHGNYFPLTHMTVADEPAGVGQHFTAVSKLGPLAMPDPMVVTQWSPPHNGGPGSFAIRKLGKVLSGTVDFTVTATPTGSELSWVTDVSPAPAPLAVLSKPFSTPISRGLYAGVLKKIVAAAEAR